MKRTSYFGEFRIGWRHLAASTLGLAAGYGINNYLNNIFIPPLMEEFGWEASQIALIGLAALSSIVCQPLAGRLTDRFGVRKVAVFGVTCGTIIYVLLSMMTGSFLQFFILSALQIALVGATTGPVVYSRLIAERYNRARGVALAIATASPSFAGAAVVPLLTGFIESEGWRAGYLVCAACAAVAGLIAILLIPSIVPDKLDKTGLDNADRPVREPFSFRRIARDPVLALIVGGIFLCSLTIVMQTTQMGVILRAAGLSASDASWVISIYALGVIAGRLLCGAALDRFPAHIVAALALGLPAIGLTILAAAIPSVAVMSAAVLFLGLSLGAEGDIGGYLAMRYFDVSIYSTIVGILIGTIACASALGSVILSVSLALWDSFAPFLILAGLCAFAGAVMMFRLGKVGAERLQT